MRQVDRDELVWVIFSALRGWSPTMIRWVFGPRHLRTDAHNRVAADYVARGQLASLQIIDGAGAELTPEQISGVIAEAILAMPEAIGDLWTSSIQERKSEARATAANLIADAFAPFEILSAAPLPPGQTFFPQVASYEHALQPRWP